MKISTKLILLLVTAVMSVMGIYALVTISQTRERLDDEMRKMAEHIGLALSVGTLHHLESGDIHGVSEVLEAISRHEDVIGAAIFDPRGNLVAASHSIAARVRGKAQVYTQDIYQRGSSENRQEYTYIHSIRNLQGQVVGSLKLVLRERSMLPYVLAVRNQVLATIFVLTLVLSGLVIYVSKKQIADPLAELTKGAEAIGRGEFDRRIEIGRGGELAALAQTFNRMAVNLEASNRRLVSEREHIQSIVDSLPEGVLVIDASGKLTAWNQAMGRIFGKALEAVLGKGISEVLCDVDSDDFRRMVHCLLNREMEKCEVRELHLRSAPERRLSAAGSPLKDTRGEGGAVLVFIDITDRVRFERQIQQSEKLAAIGQLAAGVAHEIGTPLNVISGSAEYLLMDTGADDSQSEELRTIVSEVGRISDLVKRLMAFARQGEPKIEGIDVTMLVDSVLVLLRRQMEKQGVDIQVHMPDALPAVSGDRDQLQQVLLNLIMNAWQAMPDGGRLGISVEQALLGDQPAQPCVKVAVADTGAGIPENRLQRIFEPFFTTKDIGKGTGLGLAIAHRIVEDHGGHIAVSSREGEGSVFEVYLPADKGGAHG